MTGIWLPAALLAGLFQAWRTALQQRLRGTLTVSGAGLVRYAYGAPVALLSTSPDRDDTIMVSDPFVDR